MSNSPNFEPDNPDALSSVLSQLQLTAEVYSEGDFCGAWALDTSGSRRIPFHLIGKGEAWLHIAGQTARSLSSGDLVLFPRDCQHVIASTSDEPLPTLINAEPVSDSGPMTNMVCGFFEFKNQAAWPLLNSLPAVIVMDLSDQSVSSTIRSLFDLMIAELSRRAPGYYTVINDLAGLPPMQYLTAWRMQLAKKLLETTRYSILDIAQRCGYESEAAFRKAFKKNMGLPPGQIRKGYMEVNTL